MPRSKSFGALVGSLGEGPRRAKPKGATYRFQLVAQTGDTFTSFGGHGPSLSVHGTAMKVAFVAGLASGGTGVFCSDGAVITPIAATNDTAVSGEKFTTIGPAVSVNGLGTVMFVATGSTASDTFVFVGSGGELSRVFVAPVEPIGGVPFQASDFGLVISAEPGEGGFVIADATDGLIKRAYPFAGHYDPFHTTVAYGPAALNNAAKLAFHATGSDGVSFGIFTGTGKETTAVATHEKFSALGRCVAVSDAGAVAFTGTPVDGSVQGIYVGVKGKARKVAEVGVLFAGFGDEGDAAAVGIDDGGNISFLARLTAGGAGIYTGPAAADRVIGTGDALFESTVTDIRFGPQAMDAGGNIAFGATLADGRSVIAIARLPQAKRAGETVVSSTKVNVPRIRKRQANKEA